MHFYPAGNLLVLFGGRRYPDPGETFNTEFISQISVLRLDSLEWFNVGCKDNRKGTLSTFPELYNFSSFLLDDMILIFGGMQGSYTQSKCLYSIKLETKRENYRSR